MPQHYITIEIKEESDLPKERHTYFYAHLKKSDQVLLIPFDNAVYWMQNIDFYFLPIIEPQQPEQPESADLNEKQKELIEMYAMILTGFKLTKDEAISELTKLTGLILDNVSQSHNNTVGPSKDQLLEACAKWYLNYIEGYNPTLCWRDGAEYALSQCKAIDLKDELVKITDWTFKKALHMNYDESKIREYVDEYLKSPENK